MLSRIAVDPNVHFGESPGIAGTGIPVRSFLELIAEGLSFETIVEDYSPDLEVEDGRACVRYATDVVAAEDIHIGIHV